MKLSNSMYDFLSFLGKVCLPAIAVAYSGLADIWNLPLKTEIVSTIGIIATLIVNIFLISVSKTYYADKVNELENTDNYKLGE